MISATTRSEVGVVEGRSPQQVLLCALEMLQSRPRAALCSISELQHLQKARDVCELTRQDVHKLACLSPRPMAAQVLSGGGAFMVYSMCGRLDRLW